jgi:trigger factor
LKVDVEETTSYQRVLTIEVPSETVETEVEKLFSELAKTATHPGFRKGKVPRKIIEGKFRKSVRQEAIETAITSSVRTALDEQKLVPLTEPELGETKFDDEGPLSFKVTVEVKPAVKLGQYKGLELKRPKTEVTDEEIDKVLERLRISQAKYIPVDRPVEKGDFIVFDFESFEDGKPLENGKGENFPLEVGSGAFGEDFENQLVGVAKDEQKRIAVTYPEDFSAKELAGKEIEFDVKVKDVKLRELPELDDDFAKDLGEHETLEKLKADLTERLEKDMKERIANFLRDQAVLKITADSEVEIPPKLGAKIAASLFEEETRRMAGEGVSHEQIAAQQEKISEFAENEAARQLKLTFVTDEIAKQEDLSVSDEELNERLEQMAEESGTRGSELREYFKSERVRERYRERLRLNKILDFVVDNAKIVDIDEAQARAEAEAAQAEDEKKGDD